MSDNVTATAIPTIDFLTVTTATDEATASLLATLLDNLTPDFMYHSRKRPWNFMGYHGQAYEGVRYGIRGEEGIVMLSGFYASRLWRLIAPQRQKCTRIDLALTVTLPEADHDVAKNAYAQALATWVGSSANVVNSRGGATTYIGSRQSRFFGRLYDKGAEQDGPVGTIWRYEVEVKKPASELAVARLLDETDPGEFIRSFVAGWFTRHGIEPLTGAEAWENAIEVGAHIRSSDKTLEWLSTQVRPSVGRLIIEGRESEVLGALGLTDYVKSTQFRFEGG